jgi:hypothetical protein
MGWFVFESWKWDYPVYSYHDEVCCAFLRLLHGEFVNDLERMGQCTNGRFPSHTVFRVESRRRSFKIALIAPE